MMYSNKGYKRNSPDKDRPYNVIPSGSITMENVPHPVYGIDNLGNQQVMMPGGRYSFPGQTVFEVPLKGNDMKKKNGGYSGTYSNGVYFEEGGPFFMPGGSAPVFMHGGKPCYNCGGKYMQQGGPPGSTPYSFNYGPFEALYGKEVSYPGDTLTDKQLQSLAASKMMERHMDNIVSMVGPDGKKYSYQMSPKDMAKLPKADKRGVLSKFFSLGEYERYLPAPRQYGGMTEAEEMKKGGHWIQGAVNPKHKGYCTPMTKSTCTPRRKAFAMTMKKHHGFHEYGGNVTQGGNMVRDNEMYAYGGYSFNQHPLARFMQNGGREPITPDDPMPGAMQLAPNPNQPNPWQPDMSNYDPSIDPNNPVNMPENQPVYNADYSQNSPEAQDNGQQQAGTVPGDNRQRGLGWGYAGAGLAMLGAGMGIASVLSDRRDARNLRNKNFNDRMTSNAFAAQNGPGSMGDYDQYGTFRPNQNTPTRPGMYYPKMGQHGGMYAAGGSYRPGQEMEMDDAEIARLRKLGYKIEVL